MVHNGRHWLYLSHGFAGAAPAVFSRADHDHAGRRRLQIKVGRRSTMACVPTPDDDLTAVEIEVLDAQFERLLKSEPGPVEKGDDDPRNSAQLAQDGTHLVEADRYRHAHRAVCMRHVIDRARIKTKNLPIQ